MALLRIDVDGSQTVLAPRGGIRDASVEALQAGVGGYFELVPGVPMVVNEDGHALGMPANHVASAMAGRLIVGPVVVAAPDGP